MPPPVISNLVSTLESEQFRAVFREDIRQHYRRHIVAAPALTENEGSHEQRRSNMLWTIVVILGILWLLGFSFHVGGGLIHLLLVIAVVVLLFNLLSGRRTV